MQKILLLFFFLLSSVCFLNAQTTVTIPAGNPSGLVSRFPYGTFAGYERSAMIFTAAEIGTTGQLTDVAFYLESSNIPNDATGVKIYMKLVAASAFPAAGTTVVSEEAGGTLVYSGTIVKSFFNTAGTWINRTLATAFNYTGGANNLEIIIETNATVTGNEGIAAKQFRASATLGNTGQAWGKNNSQPAGYGTVVNYRPNIQLIFASPPPTITSIPAGGCPGDVITIGGTNFNGITAVKFNGVNAISYNIVNSTTITAVVPGTPSTGPVTLTNPGGTGSSSPSNFTIKSAPAKAIITGAGTFCNSTTISASGAIAGETMYFQGTTTNGTSISTPSASQVINTSGTYYFRIFNGTCWGTEGSVDVTIDNVPGVVSVSAPPGPYCGSTTITAGGGSGATIYFQGTNPNGTSTATPSTSQLITTSGTYYFNAKNSCNTFGPSGSINVIINPVPGSITVTGGGVKCGSTILNASGGLGGTIYYQDTTTGGTSVTLGGSVSPVLAVADTYYFRSLSPAGCWGPETATAVSFPAGIAFTSQFTDRVICAGGSTVFSVSVSPSPVSYQWRIGTTNLSNVAGNISGVNTNTLTISNATPSNSAIDYNCVASSACGSIVSNYARLTVYSAAVAPTAQSTNLTFLTGVTSAIGSYTLSTDAMGYLVIRTLTNTQPSNPVNGTTYIAGNPYFSGGLIEYAGPNDLFNSGFLTQNTTYYYWIYAYNINPCGANPLYLAASPLTGSITTGTTTSCGSPAPFPLYWFGQGSLISGSTNSTDFNDPNNWSRSPASYVASPFAPDKCTDVSIAVQSRGIFNVDFTDPGILLTADADVHDLTYTSNQGYLDFGFTQIPYFSIATLSTQGYRLQVFGDASIDLGDNAGNVANIGEGIANGIGVIDFKADVLVGTTNNSNGSSVLQGNTNSKFIFRGALTLGRTASIVSASTPGTVEFDGIAFQPVLWNNSLYPVNFQNVIIGNINSPTVQPKTVAVKPDNILGNLTINNSATLNLATSQWNRQTGTGIFTMNGTSTLKLAAAASTLSSRGQGIFMNGSNFPGGFTAKFSAGSTVEYNAAGGINQTVFNIPVYGNLILSNGTLLATSIKTLTANMNGIAGNLTINPYAVFNIDYKANRTSTGGTFSMAANGFLVLNGTSGGAGSNNNFPANFSTYNFNPSSTTVYSASAPQGIFGGVDYGHLTLNGSSTITAPAGNLTVKGNLSKYTASIFFHNNGTVILSGSGAQAYSSSPPTMDFYNLTNNNSVGSSINSDLSVSNKLLLGNNSKLNLGVGYITLKSSAANTARVSTIPSSATINYVSTGLFVAERYIATGSGGSPNHGKSWQLLAIPTTGSSLYNGQTIKQAWQEGATASNVSLPSPGTAGNLNAGYGTMLTSDVAGAKSQPAPGFDEFTPLGPSIKTFNSVTLGFDGPTSTALPVYNPKGYFVFVRGDRSVYAYNQIATPTVLRTKGRLFTATYLPPATSLAVNAIESVGNPYASPIDFRLVPRSGLSDAFQVWDPRLGGGYNYGAFQTFTKDAAGNYAVTPGGGSYGAAGTINNFIQSGQAFFVQTVLGSSGSISFTEAAKGDTASILFTRPSRAPQLEMSLRTSLYSVNGGQALLDGILNEFDNSYSNAIDGMDARKSMNTGENLSIKTSGRLLVVERNQIPTAQDTIFLNLTNERAQPYRFGFDATNLNTGGLQGYLEDTYLHIKTPLNMSGNTMLDFSIANIPGSYAADRFRIVFAQAKALPVTITNVKAYGQDKNIKVEWKVENELNIKDYTVEKSADGIHFTNLTVRAATGNSSSSVSYQVVDDHPVIGYNYYRIRSNDKDGKGTLTQVVKALMGTLKQDINVYPNPVTDGKIHLQFMYESEGKYSLRLLNKAGQVILARQITKLEGSNTELIKPDFNLSHGIYQLEVTKPDGSIKNINVVY